MKLITRDTDYAIRALCYIAGEKEGIVAASDLVKKLKIPRSFLRKILQVLNRKRLLKSYKGKGGGFILNVAPRKISLAQLIGIFQGRLRLNECFFKKGICPNRKTCPLKKKIDRIERYVIKELEGISLADLLK